ncbi:hypothetical protein F2P79_004511, partial [Pimephales promelas]
MEQLLLESRHSESPSHWMRRSFHFRTKTDSSMILKGEERLRKEEERERRQRVSHHDEFHYDGKLLCVDQPEMTVPLVDHMNPTCRMKTIAVDGKPQLCLFAPNNEEITYNHGDPEWPSDARYGNFT